jgi:hypothetical protein
MIGGVRQRVRRRPLLVRGHTQREDGVPVGVGDLDERHHALPTGVPVRRHRRRSQARIRW